MVDIRWYYCWACGNFSLAWWSQKFLLALRLQIKTSFRFTKVALWWRSLGWQRDGGISVGVGFTGWLKNCILIQFWCQYFWGLKSPPSSHPVFWCLPCRKVIEITCSWQTLMNTCQFGYSLVGCFAVKVLVCNGISRNGSNLSFSGSTPKHPPKSKTDLFVQSNCRKGLVLTRDIGHSPCLNKSLWGWRNKLVHNANQNWGPVRIQTWVNYAEFLGSEILQDFQGQNHLKGIHVHPLKRYQWSEFPCFPKGDGPGFPPYKSF